MPDASARMISILAGVLGLTGVAAGAFGAHGLDHLPADQLGWWETAARYQLFHALALLALVAVGAPGPARTWSARLFGLGIVCFCGSLYAMALGGPRWLGAVAPVGGAGLMGGWLALIIHASRRA